MGQKGIEENGGTFSWKGETFSWRTVGLFLGRGETFSCRGDQHTQEFFGGSSRGLEGLIRLPFRHIKRVFFRYNTG